MIGYGVLTEARAVRLERLLPGPIERVWSYLTDSGKRGSWLASGEMELRVGGRVEHVFRNSQLTGHDDPPPAKYAQHAGESRMQGRITACEPPRLLAYTWQGAPGEDSEVTFELTPRATTRSASPAAGTRTSTSSPTASAAGIQPRSGARIRAWKLNTS